VGDRSWEVGTGRGGDDTGEAEAVCFRAAESGPGAATGRVVVATKDNPVKNFGTTPRRVLFGAAEKLKPEPGLGLADEAEAEVEEKPEPEPNTAPVPVPIPAPVPATSAGTGRVDDPKVKVGFGAGVVVVIEEELEPSVPRLE
jgi:hypothetical protein